MRQQEHTWEPFGPAMVTKISAAIDRQGNIVDWNYEVWSNTHSMRPGGAGSLLAGPHMGEGFAVPGPRAVPPPGGGGDPNANPPYRLPSSPLGHHLLAAIPVRLSALRGPV